MTMMSKPTDKQDPTVIDLAYDPHTNQFAYSIDEAIIKAVTPPSLGKEVVTSARGAEQSKNRQVTVQHVKLGLHYSGKAIKIATALTVTGFIVYSLVRLAMLLITAAITLWHWFIEAAPIFGTAIVYAILSYGACKLVDHTGTSSPDIEQTKIRRPERRDEDDTRGETPDIVKPVTLTQPAWACRLAAQWVAWLRANGDVQSIGMWRGGQYDSLAHQYGGDIATAVNIHCNDKCAVSGLLDCHNPNGWGSRGDRKTPDHRDWDLMCATFGKHWLMKVARSNDGGRSFKKIANDIEHDLQRNGFLTPTRSR
jgi:hypothetical protein